MQGFLEIGGAVDDAVQVAAEDGGRDEDGRLVGEQVAAVELQRAAHDPKVVTIGGDQVAGEPLVARPRGPGVGAEFAVRHDQGCCARFRRRRERDPPIPRPRSHRVAR